MFVHPAKLMTALAVIVFVMLGQILGAQEFDTDFDMGDPIEPALIEKARTGDAYANYLLGFKYFQLRDGASINKALTHLLVAKEGYAKAEKTDMPNYAGALNTLGNVYMERAEFAKAIRTFTEAIEITRIIGDPLNRGFNEQALGLSLQGLSRYEEAIGFFQSARASFIQAEGPDGPNSGDTYLNEGISWEGMKDYDKALTAYRQARKIYENAFGPDAAVVGYTINNIAWVLRRLEQYDLSFGMFKDALVIIDRVEGSYSINSGKVRINLGIVEYQRGNWDEAIRWTMRAMPFIQANGDVTLSDQRWAFDTLARAFKAKGDAKKAIVFAKLAVNAHQAIRRNNGELAAEDTQELNQEWQWLYQHLADLLIEQGRIAEAQAVLNMVKEQEVFEFLRRDAKADVSDTKSLLNDAELSQEQELAAIATMPVSAANELSRLMAKLENGEISAEEEERIFALQDTIQAATDAFEAEVEAFLSSLDLAQSESFQDQMQAVGAYQSVLEGFDEKVAILQIAAIGDTTHLFLTLPQVTIHEQVNTSKADLSRLVFDTLQAVEARAPDTNIRLNTLYSVLLEPVAQELAQSETEIVMLNLDGVLRYVPFAALFDGQSYAVEKYAFVNYSTTVPTQFRRAKRSAVKSVGFGVTQAFPGFAALPGVRDELETIFAGKDGKGVLRGVTMLNGDFDQRELKRALLKRPEILHIASHFSLVPGREDDSFLLLGDGAYLRLSDIRRTKALSFRGVDLLTLSACQTALGSGDGSEIEGFAATAQLNGASAVLATLWPVSDESTPELMRGFYQKMIGEGLSKAVALQDAQIAMLRGQNFVVGSISRSATALDDAASVPVMPGLTHPFFWSPFVLMGNWL